MEETGESESQPAASDNGDSRSEDDADMVLHEIDEIFEPATEHDEEDEYVKHKLPPHRKCVCHLLNLIATTDVSKLQGTVKRTSVQAFAKLTGLWNKQNRSAAAVEKIKSALGTYLITPGDT
jgi:hypothetical protein